VPTTDTQPAMKQDAIRQWARERNLRVGHRGRLPPSIIEAYRKETTDPTGNAVQSEHREDPTEAVVNRYEPLADYLEPRFGNIYDWENSVVPYIPLDGFDVQPWTDEMRQAVREYLVHVAPEQLLELAFPYCKGTPPEEWADDALNCQQPWEVALLFHEAAVASLPTLDALIGHLQTWPYEDDRDDAVHWLEQHATKSQLSQLAIASKQADLAQSGTSDLAFYLLRKLEPPTLLKAWHDVSDSAPSDLADSEWGLLTPFIPQGLATSAMAPAIYAAEPAPR
jgi:hypothetical protein